MPLYFCPIRDVHTCTHVSSTLAPRKRTLFTFSRLWSNERSGAKFRPSEFAGTLLSDLAQKKISPSAKKIKFPAVQNRVEISSKTEESELLEGFVWAGERIEWEPPGLLLLLLWVFVEIFLFVFGFADIVVLNVELLLLLLPLIFRGFYNSTQSCSKDLSFACHYEFQHCCR